MNVIGDNLAAARHHDDRAMDGSVAMSNDRVRMSYDQTRMTQGCLAHSAPPSEAQGLVGRPVGIPRGARNDPRGASPSLGPSVPSSLSGFASSRLGVSFGHRGFTFTEVLFAVLLLGVGFIMLAGIFPVAIRQAQTSVEQTGDQEVVQYRGSILPLIRLSHILGVSPSTNSSDVMQVIVYSEGTRSVGIVVDRILDIVETSFDPQTIVSAPGIIATAVIQQRVTDLLDIQTIIRSVRLPHFESVAV
mgnify:CR=1 FL=1